MTWGLFITFATTFEMWFEDSTWTHTHTELQANHLREINDVSRMLLGGNRNDDEIKRYYEPSKDMNHEHLYNTE